MNQTPLPQPQLEPTGITSDQYEAYTLEKLELWNGFYEYGGQDPKGFYLAVLTNMVVMVTHSLRQAWELFCSQVESESRNLGRYQVTHPKSFHQEVFPPFSSEHRPTA
jgi:hypothetical protein